MSSDIDLDGCEPHRYPWGGTAEMQQNRMAREMNEQDRREFEEFAVEENANISRGIDGVYLAAWTKTAWIAWQAARASAERVSVPYTLPEGFVLVPMPPTYAMCVAGCSSSGARMSGPDDCNDVYRAMLAAAPKVQGEPHAWALTEWVDCPICREPGMRKTSDAEGNYPLIHCVNHRCPSNTPTATVKECLTVGDGCTCHDCGAQYRGDLLVPDSVWHLIKPASSRPGAGLLCASCIMRRIVDSGIWSAARATDVDAPATTDVPDELVIHAVTGQRAPATTEETSVVPAVMRWRMSDDKDWLYTDASKCKPSPAAVVQCHRNVGFQAEMLYLAPPATHPDARDAAPIYQHRARGDHSWRDLTSAESYAYWRGQSHHETRIVYEYQLGSMQVAQDAARYRWLRSGCLSDKRLLETIYSDDQPPHKGMRCGADLDTAIDRAMGAKDGQS